MKVKDFVAKAKEIVNKYKTLYVLGSFGSPMTSERKKYFINKSSYNKKRSTMINKASSDTFGFDCVCLIKGILWGWNGNKNKPHGGAIYKSNGIPDFGSDEAINLCTNVSSNFSKIEEGEIVWMKGHVGIYIGSSEVIECSPAFKNKVQITKLFQRKWLKHGKLKYIDYSGNIENKPITNSSSNTPSSNEKPITNVNIQYYPKSNYKGTSIVTALAQLNINHSYSYRAKIAAKNGITGYRGSAVQNTKMLNLLKEGKLKKV